MNEITDEVISEGYILTLADGRELLLMQRIEQCFFAAVGITDDKPDDHYYLLEATRDEQGDICVMVWADLGKIQIL